jgi:hypothetical protein
MTYVAVLDIASFIWDHNDYEANEPKYHVMMHRMLNLQDHLIRNKSQILLRFELYDQIMIEFPHAIVSSRFSDFTHRTLRFFMDIGERMKIFPARTLSITSAPILFKDHFSATTKSEVQYLLNQIHSEPKPDVKFFTYEYLWAGGNLKTVNGNDELEHETLVADDVKYLEKFFTRYRLTFEHNNKHDRYNEGTYISGLSCYNDRTQDTRHAQSLLDTSKKHGNNYYNYDLINDVWVVFRQTRDNIYHAHDERNLSNIPNEIRKHFSK